MWLVKGAPNLMQRLPRLPPVPNVTLLDRRKPKSLSWPHANTTFTQQTYIRWCCIDLSNAPRLSGTKRNISFWFAFSRAKSQKLWLDPNTIPPFWMKFYVSISVESLNGVDLSEHAF